MINATGLLEPTDKLSKTTVATLAVLTDEYMPLINKIADKDDTYKDTLTSLGILVDPEDPEDATKDATEDTPEEEPVLTLEEEINTLKSLKELKDIARSNKEFKSLRDNITAYSNVGALRKDMLNILKEENPTPKESEANKPKVGSSKKKEKKVDQTIDKSTVHKGMKEGSKVEFVTARNHREFPSKKLTGTVLKVYISGRMGKEAVQIKTSKGVFFKVSTAVTLKE